MNIKDFIEVYKNAANVNDYCKKRVITDKYITYQEKLAFCQNIVDKTCYIARENGDKIFSQNTPARYMIFQMTMINLYTDIEVDFEHLLDDFNTLDQYGAVDILVSSLAEFNPHEYSMFNTLLKMIVDDAYANTRDLVSWLETKVETIEMAFKSLSEVLKDVDLSKLIKENEDNA